MEAPNLLTKLLLILQAFGYALLVGCLLSLRLAAVSLESIALSMQRCEDVLQPSKTLAIIVSPLLQLPSQRGLLCSSLLSYLGSHLSVLLQQLV